MARDCEQLSPKAAKIFKKLEPFFIPDPWGRPQWCEDGRIKDNWDYDLRKAEDRARLEDWYQKMIGSHFTMEANRYLRTNGNLDGFERVPRSQLALHWMKLLLILEELSFQIETLDLCEDVG